MKIIITLQDTEEGAVRVDSDPSLPTLIAMRRNDDLTPASGYAIIALCQIMKDSLKEARRKMRLKLPDRFTIQ